MPESRLITLPRPLAVQLLPYVGVRGTASLALKTSRALTARFSGNARLWRAALDALRRADDARFGFSRAQAAACLARRGYSAAVERDADAYREPDTGRTRLLLAARAGDVDHVCALLTLGVDLDARTKLGDCATNYGAVKRALRRPLEVLAWLVSAYERGGGGGGGGGARREEDDADDELRACAALGLAVAGGATLDAQTNRAADRAARASYELQRRFDAACVRASAVSLHPGAVHAHSRRASGDSSAAAVQTPKGVYGTLTGRRVVGPGGPRSAGGHAHFSPS